MAISNELNTLKANILSAYTMIQNKGGTIPANKNTQNLSNAINTIQGGGSGTDYFVDSISSNNYKAIKLIKSIPPITVGNNVTSMQELFSNCSSLNTISLLDTSKVTNMTGMFRACTSLTTVPLLDTSKVTKMQEMFSGCSSLITIPLLDTSSVTNMQSMFLECSALTTIPLLDTSSVTNMSSMFLECSALTTIPLLDTSSVTNMTGIFKTCTSLTTIPLLDTSSIINIWRIFNNCSNIENIGGFQNLGNAYSKTASVNTYQYELSLSKLTKLTHDSLMNVINNLYDITTKGCKAQKLTLGTDNMAKLTAEEIAIATNKGWTVS